MKASVVGRELGILCLAILMAWLSPGCREPDEENDLPEADSYPPERRARFCDRLREEKKMYRAGDLVGQLDLLRDKDPWVRDIVYLDLRNLSIVSSICIDPPFIDFDPWGDPQEIEEQVTAFKKCMMENEDRWLRFRHPNLSEDEKRRREERNRRYEENEKKDERMLRRLIQMAENRLNWGDKRAIYPLKALLDYPDQELQATALAWLILNTERELYPKGGEGLKLGKVDPKVLKKKKKQWLAWWKKNGKTFQPKRSHPSRWGR